MKLPTDFLLPDELQYVTCVLHDFEAPDLQGIWSLMDAAWKECQCDPDVMDERITRFYNHPVWLLNGLFIEQDPESLCYRRAFCEYVAGLNPRRVADFGGGYGTLARMIGARCPETEVHIVEPNPHSTAIVLAEQTHNVRYVPELVDEYDVLIATDLFEHVPDPLAMVEKTAAHLCLSGEYLIANYFWPVILCHLPATFHFRWSWDCALEAMNLQPGCSVAYGRSYRRVGPVSAASARTVEMRSKRWCRLIGCMPPYIRSVAIRLLLTGGR